MQDSWIPICMMQIPYGDKCRILLFTPNDDPTVRYRMVRACDSKKLVDVTHWQPCLDPAGEE